MFAERRFRPELVPSLVTAALLPLLVSLGLWQHGKWQDRTAAQTTFAAATGQLSVFDGADAPTLFDRYEVTGCYDSERQFLIDNITVDGRVGFYVITPLTIAASGRTMLVNRGWVPGDPARRALPDVAVGRQERTLTGRAATLPSVGLKLDGPSVEPGWPSVRQFPDVAELAAALGLAAEDVVSLVLLLDRDADEGFVRDWKPTGLPPERHLGYAVQWFALAVTLVVLWLILSYRRHDD